MNIKIEAGVLTAKAVVVQCQTTIEIKCCDILDINTSSRSIFSSVISVGGTSISSITPDFNLLGVGAAA